MGDDAILMALHGTARRHGLMGLNGRSGPCMQKRRRSGVVR
jgi:hypothetical protein